MRYALVLVALAGCSDVKSDSLLTSGMAGVLSVDADGAGKVTASAVLHAGGPLSTTYVELTADDALTASDADESVPMDETSLGAYHAYDATMNTSTEGTVYTIALTRTIDDGAPVSTMTLPDDFTLDTPSETAYSRAADLTLTWDADTGGATMGITIAGDCIDTYSDGIDGDPGTYTVTAGSLVPSSASGAPTTCMVTVQVHRSLTGSLDAAYGEGGSATATQSRKIIVNSTP